MNCYDCKYEDNCPCYYQKFIDGTCEDFEESFEHHWDMMDDEEE